MRAGLETLRIIESEGLMANAVAQGERIRAGLARELAGCQGVKDIRGKGLMIGIELDRPCGELVKQALEARLLINVTQDTVIRLLPPLILNAAEADQIVARLAPCHSAVRCHRRARAAVAAMAAPIRHFLQLYDFTRAEFEHVFARTRVIKDRFKRYEFYQPLRDRTLAMVFEKASTRTRVSLRGRHVPDGRLGHPHHDRRFPARARRADRGHRARDFAHGRHRDDPHLRAGEDRALCRALARAGHQRPDQRVSSVPDPRRHLHLHRASRPDRRPHGGVDRRRQQHGLHVAAGRAAARLQGQRVDAARICARSAARARAARTSPSLPTRWSAARGADLVTTDVWTSMGFEAENEARRRAFADWRVDATMMRAGRPDALFMHCLPAHRGEEVTADVLDGPQSVVWDEAENRLHVQKALMEYLLLGREVK